MEVVEFGNPREPALQHFSEGQPRDSLDVIRGEASAQAVHGLPPGPEMVVRPIRAARSDRRSRAGTCGCEDCRGPAPRRRDGLASEARDPAGRPRRLDRGHPSVRDPDRHGVLPTVRCQGGIEKQLVHGGGSDGVWRHGRRFGRTIAGAGVARDGQDPNGPIMATRPDRDAGSGALRARVDRGRRHRGP